MMVIVTACSAFGFTVSEVKTEIMCLQTKGEGKVSFTINATGQVQVQTNDRVCVLGRTNQRRQKTLHRDITRRL